MKVCRTPEEFKAWSQNLGHDHVLTTFNSYGKVEPARQASLIRGLYGGRNIAAADDPATNILRSIADLLPANFKEGA